MPYPTTHDMLLIDTDIALFQCKRCSKYRYGVMPSQFLWYSRDKREQLLDNPPECVWHDRTPGELW